jgi:AcrR family transcriptional regulator
MPKLVDRTERREEVLEATWRLMARVGIDRVSIREIAAEAGYSTGVIAHYFRNKDDVLLSALRLLNSQEVERVERATAGLRGLTALQAAIGEVLPVGNERKLEMTVWMSFWGRAVGDASLATFQRRSYGEWCSLLRGHFEEAVADTELPHDLDCADEAARTAALIDGLSIQAMLEPERMTARKVVDIMDSHLRSFAARERHSRPGGGPEQLTSRLLQERRRPPRVNFVHCEDTQNPL